MTSLWNKQVKDRCGLYGVNMSIYKRYCNELVDENDRLKKIRLDYPDNFNLGYDVVDQIADETPKKRALVWGNVEGK